MHAKYLFSVICRVSKCGINRDSALSLSLPKLKKHSLFLLLKGLTIYSPTLYLRNSLQQEHDFT